MKKISLFLGIALMSMSLSAFASTDVACSEPSAPVAVCSVPGENWDKLLNDYEKAVNDYLKALKKDKKTSATPAQIAKLKKRVENLGKRLENAEEKLTSAQLKRYNKIRQKLALIED